MRAKRQRMDLGRRGEEWRESRGRVVSKEGRRMRGVCVGGREFTLDGKES